MPESAPKRLFGYSREDMARAWESAYQVGWTDGLALRDHEESEQLPPLPVPATNPYLPLIPHPARIVMDVHLPEASDVQEPG